MRPSPGTWREIDACHHLSGGIRVQKLFPKSDAYPPYGCKTGLFLTPMGFLCGNPVLHPYGGYTRPTTNRMPASSSRTACTCLKASTCSRQSADSRMCPFSCRAGNRRFWQLSALRAHTKAPYKTDLHRKTRRALNRSWAARTVGGHDTVDHRRAARGELRLDLCPVLELLLHRP